MVTTVLHGWCQIFLFCLNACLCTFCRCALSSFSLGHVMTICRRGWRDSVTGIGDDLFVASDRKDVKHQFRANLSSWFWVDNIILFCWLSFISSQIDTDEKCWTIKVHITDQSIIYRCRMIRGAWPKKFKNMLQYFICETGKYMF